MPAPVYPANLSGLPRITQSALDTYQGCGIRWGLERDAKHRYATVPMLRGTAISGAAKEDGRQKILMGVGLTIGETVDIAVTEYEAELEDTEVPDSKSAIIDGKDSTADAARCYATDVSPRIKDIVEVETPLVANVEGQFQIAGTPDVVDQDGLGDLKTGRRRTQEDADWSEQLTIYGLLDSARRGQYPRRLWIESIWETPRGSWAATRLWTHRTADDYAAMIYAMQQAAKGMAAGVTLKAKAGSWWCSRKWCPFYGNGCPAVNGRRT